MKKEFVFEAKKVWNHTQSVQCSGCQKEIQPNTERNHTYTTITGAGEDYGTYCPHHDMRYVKKSIMEAHKVHGGFKIVDMRSISIRLIPGLHQ